MSKMGLKVSQLAKQNYLSVIALLLTGLLILEEMYFLNSPVVGSVSISLDLLSCSSYTLLIKLVLVLSSSLILLLGISSTIKEKMYEFEFSQLILLSTLGMMILVSSSDLIMLYLGIELMSLSLYVLAALKREGDHSTEAGLKYFLLGALSSGILLFGMVLIYTFTGETTFVGLNNYI
jgi:NADH-quinone oxidoreductase subunit N